MLVVVTDQPITENTVGVENRVLDRAREWTQWSETRAQHVVATAASASLHGSPAWDALLAEAGVQALGPLERQHHVSAGPPRASGPSPIEVRRALESLRAQMQRAAKELEHATTHSGAEGDDDATERAIDGLKRLAGRIVDEHLRRYIATVRPKITTSSIFANAMASSRNYTAQGVNAGMTTLACDCCGAPRCSGTTSRVCEFCGSKL
jgi:hypothetical protein